LIPVIAKVLKQKGTGDDINLPSLLASTVWLFEEAAAHCFPVAQALSE
jgi:hypothetical protein